MSSSSGSSSIPTSNGQGKQNTGTQGPSTIDLLLRNVPNSPETVITALASQPQFAKKADDFGYTLLHAAVSYSHADLARALVKQYGALVDAVDEEGETALFYAESVDMAKLLVEELGADVGWRNYEGDRFAEKLDQTIKDGEAEGWEPDMQKYISSVEGMNTPEYVRETPAPRTQEAQVPVTVETVLKDTAPGNVPDMSNLSITLREEHLWHADETDWDSEIKHRIENMTRFGDLSTGEAQAEMRGIVTDVIHGLREQGATDADEDERGRRRTRTDE